MLTGAGCCGTHGVGTHKVLGLAGWVLAALAHSAASICKVPFEVVLVPIQAEGLSWLPSL